MNIPGIGEFTPDEDVGGYASEPIEVPMLGNQECTIFLEGYDDDDKPEEFLAAVRKLLAADVSVLEAVQQELFRYCEDVNSQRDPSDEDYLAIDSPEAVWDCIEFGDELYVTRRPHGDQGIYVSIECSCDWEPEHGLQIVLKNGERVTKVGMFDGHLSNADSYADAALENVVYHPLR
ncbi:hypothetical protein [Acidovorax sp. Root219]|uniref:DUF6985 domain-containing protein n=1 Tax=Acidovorax sp. Root219 TaxID=1736493 RepID=UPI00070F9B3F|nr:hypothetical protein [Acidovorax sp. Root219]KRC21707.1 hypothetical protein ASE28_03455 [Acidovorax sp. Root219]